jgi:hypothetical protein
LEFLAAAGGGGGGWLVVADLLVFIKMLIFLMVDFGCATQINSTPQKFVLHKSICVCESQISLLISSQIIKNIAKSVTNHKNL